LILVDSSVWIDYFNGTLTAHTEKLHLLLDREFLAIGDLILVEVLQGFTDERDFHQAAQLLEIIAARRAASKRRPPVFGVPAGSV